MSLQSQKRRQRTADVLCFLLVILFSCAAMLPIWWIFRSSLMSNAELFKWPPSFFPPRWLFSNYANTLQYFKFWTYLKNTMLIIVPSVIAGTITATMCGYAFARLRFKLRGFLFTRCIGSMLLPTMVTLVPLYVMWTKFLGLSDTYWPLILPYFCGGGAFNIFLIRQFVMSVPRELDEAATIDGAGYFRILTSVIVPAIKPAMIVVAMFLFIQIWNDLLQQMVYINTEAKFTISMGLSQLKGSLKTDWSAIMCGTCMSFVPGVVFYLLSLALGNLNCMVGPFAFALGLLVLCFALGRGSYAFLLRAMFDLKTGEILKNANAMAAVRSGRGCAAVLLDLCGLFPAYAFFPYSLIAIALIGISLHHDLLCYLLNAPIQERIIAPWEEMQEAMKKEQR